jgi:hypothetical protein
MYCGTENNDVINDATNMAAGERGRLGAWVQALGLASCEHHKQCRQTISWNLANEPKGGDVRTEHTAKI